MAGKIEVIIGVIDDGVTVGSGAVAVSDQLVTSNEGGALLSQSAQTGAVVASVTSVTKLAGPYVPIISLPGNIVAGTITFLKVGMDVKAGREVKKGELYSLLGNVVGVVGTFVVLSGAGPFFVGSLAVAAVATGLLSIYHSDTFGRLMAAADDFFRNNRADSYLDYMCAPDMRIVDRNTLRMAYANKIFSCNWVSATGELLPSSVVVHNESNSVAIGGGGGGGGGGEMVLGGTYTPFGSSASESSGYGVGRVDISLEFGGDIYGGGDKYLGDSYHK